MSPQAFPRSGYHYQRLLWQHDTALHVHAGKLGACRNSVAAGRRCNLRARLVSVTLACETGNDQASC